MKKVKKQKEFRLNIYSVCFAVVIIGVAIVIFIVNIIVDIVDEKFNICIDMTKEQYTVLTDETKTILDNLDQDIYLYYIGASEQDDVIAAALLKNYAAASQHVYYQMIDPDSYPDYAGQFDLEGVDMQSVIVSDTDVLSGYSPVRYKVLPLEELYTFSIPYYNQHAAADYEYFNGEQKITSVIDYIVTGETKRAVFLEGHCEKTPCTTLLDDLDDMYYEAGQYSFATSDRALDPSSDTLIVISP
ncbi:MAG: Gldg family protein, partial [Eubacteriales bacterium]|nr:Gldg family protein [Eubacteriales bacterium]